MFPLTPDLAAFLTGEAARQALASLTDAEVSEQGELATLGRLRRAFPPDQAAALLDQARLQRRAAGKFPGPQRLLFTDEALQQASSRAVALYRASQMAAALGAPGRPARVADLGCGIGADTVALAEAGLEVLAVERDPVRARIAAFNVAALGLAGRAVVVEGDWTSPSLAPWTRVSAAFVDPARRSDSRRIFDPEAADPPLSAILPLAGLLDALAVKTLPGIADDDIPPSAEVEFISEQGQMKEALLRFGRLKTGAARRATLLPGPHHLDSNAPVREVAAGEPLAWLLEPDAAIIRATLVQHLATKLTARQIDPSIAYLTCWEPVESPFARCWPIARHGPFHLKTLNRWLHELNAGEVVVKKRGSAVDPDAFRRRLKTIPGGALVTVFLTRVLGKPWMIAARDELGTASRLCQRPDQEAVQQATGLLPDEVQQQERHDQ